ncbi:unnamed protein product [Paramecium primaurelia]|uniref:Uncharacterized protein n=1 Tax=Paramecium primaurelia TaxID=5886 RepID=A0A8S1PXX0_PARPR|nr:unnamed protein product [Paramecium primaurelia]
MSQYRPQRINISRTTQPQQDSLLLDNEQLKSPQFAQEQSTLPRSTYRTPDARVNHFDGIQNEEIYKKKINELQRQNDDLREKYLQVSSENQVIIQEQREEIEQYQNEVNILKEQLMQKEIEMKQLNDLNQSLKQEISDWEVGFDKLEQDYNHKLKIEDDSQRILSEVQLLNEENQKLQEEYQEKDRLYNQCKQQLQSIQIDLNQLQQDSQYNQELLIQKDREIHELKQQIERNKEQSRKQQEFSNKQDLLTKEVQKLNQQVKQLQKENQDLKNEKQLISLELQENRANPEYLSKINLLGQEVERLNNTLALKSRELNDYKAQINRMQKEIQNLRMNEFQLQDMNMSLDNLINQYNKLKDDNQILKQQISQKQNKINTELDKKIQILQQECEKLSLQLNSSKKENDYLREQLNISSQLEDTNRLLKSQVDKLQMQTKQLENERQSLMQEYQLLSNSYNNQKFNYSQLLQEQQENNDSVLQLKNEIQRLQKIIQDTIDKNPNNSNHQDIIQQLQKDLEIANKQIPLLKQTIQKLKNELDITKEFITQNQYEQSQSQIDFNNQKNKDRLQQPIIQQDQKLIDKLQKYEIRFPQLVEEIERLNKILTERNEEILIYKKNSFQSDQVLEKVNAYEGEIERLRQTILLKQQTIDSLQQQKENPGVQDLIFKLQDENRRLTNLVSVRNNEIAELKFKLSEYEQKQKLLSESNSGKYELQNMILNQEIDQLNQKLLDAKNEISLLKLTKNDKFNEERGKVLTQELEKQIRINKENEKELLSLRSKFAEVVDAERKLIDCKCLLVLLYNELERLNQEKQNDNLLF